jgi:hypothetical protein
MSAATPKQNKMCYVLIDAPPAGNWRDEYSFPVKEEEKEDDPSMLMSMSSLPEAKKVKREPTPSPKVNKRAMSVPEVDKEAMSAPEIDKEVPYHPSFDEVEIDSKSNNSFLQYRVSTNTATRRRQHEARPREEEAQAQGSRPHPRGARCPQC